MTVVGALRRRYARSFSTALSFKTVLAEIIGVAAFVFVGCGAAALVTAPTSFVGQTDANSNFNTLFVGIAFGAAIFVAISATAHNNSDQLNPAVSVALMAAGSCPLLQARTPPRHALFQISRMSESALAHAALAMWRCDALARWQRW